MPRKFWNSEKDEALKKLIGEYADICASQLDYTISAILGTTAHAITKRRSRLKLFCMTSFRFRPPRKELCRNPPVLEAVHEEEKA